MGWGLRPDKLPGGGRLDPESSRTILVPSAPCVFRGFPSLCEVVLLVCFPARRRSLEAGASPHRPPAGSPGSSQALSVTIARCLTRGLAGGGLGGCGRTLDHSQQGSHSWSCEPPRGQELRMPLGRAQERAAREVSSGGWSSSHWALMGQVPPAVGSRLRRCSFQQLAASRRGEWTASNSSRPQGAGLPLITPAPLGPHSPDHHHKRCCM